MILSKPYTKKQYVEFAEYCNLNNSIIEDKGDYLESRELPKPSEEELKKTEINALKKQLDDTDYKIIKCSEYSLAGKELPYDIEYLHTQRQTIRDRITELGG